MAIEVAERKFIEYVLVEAQIVEVVSMIGHRACVACEVLLYKCDRRRIEFSAVQTDAEFAVADDGVLV